MSGIFGIDKSKTTKVQTSADNSNVAAGGEGSNAQRFELASGASLNILDSGAIASSLDFANASLDSAFKFANESLGLADRATGKLQNAFEDSLAQSLSVSESERTGGANRTLYIAGAALAAVIAVIFVLKH